MASWEEFKQGKNIKVDTAENSAGEKTSAPVQVRETKAEYEARVAKELEEERKKYSAPVPAQKTVRVIADNKSDDNSNKKPLTALKETPTEDYSFNSLDNLKLNLENCLRIIDDEVMKGYLTNLDKLPIIEADEETLKRLPAVHFIRITELVYQEEEFSAQKLSALFHALRDKPCTLALMIKSDGQTNEFFLGARSRIPDFSTATMAQTLKQSLTGLFPGSQFEDYYNEDLEKNMREMNFDCLSGVTCVADFRQKIDNMKDKQFTQGMEKFIESMRGKSYRAIFIADNVGYNELIKVKRNYESISTQISPFVNMQMNFSLTDSRGESKGRSDGKSSGTSQTKNIGSSIAISDGETFTTGRNESYGETQTKGSSDTISDGRTKTDGKTYGESGSESNAHTDGSSKSGGVSLIVNANYSSNSSDTHTTTQGWSRSNSESNSISRTLSHGVNESRGISQTTGTNESESKSQTISRGTTESESYGNTETINFMESLTLTDTFGKTQGITLNSKNATFASIVDRLSKQLKRIEECESFGMWNFAAYFVGASAAETEAAANIYQSVVSGANSGIECSAINTWQNKNDLAKLSPYIKNFLHPRFLYRGFDYESERYEEVTPAALVSANELSIHMGLPYSSVSGLPVVTHASFAQEVISKTNPDAKKIRLGAVYHMGKMLKLPVNLDLNCLTSHTFVTGSTGAGKSNVVCQILSEVCKYGATFLVIEPTKGEYAKAFPQAKHFGTNPNLGDIVKLNPFAFPASIHVLEHIDRLIEIFNVCWPMYAAMPAILKNAVERAYIMSGWDLEFSVNRYSPELFPTFQDVSECVREILNESEYSAENKGDYIGSLVTRLHSLTNGINGLIFTADETPAKELFAENAVVDLSRVGSTETKALIMGILVLKLQEYRMEERALGGELNSELRHITVLEEAHNLLRRVSTEQNIEGANAEGKSVELLANAIAEMRTYGEGFIIADQSPGLLDMSAIRNTNTKIILRLPDISDRELVGKAAGLNDMQIAELIKLERGVAAVSQIEWLEPVLCKVDFFDTETGAKDVKLNSVEYARKNDDLKEILLDFIMERGVGKTEELQQKVIKSKLGARVKCDFLEYVANRNFTTFRKFAYEFLEAEKAVMSAKKCSDIVSWTHRIIENLSLSVKEYQAEKINDLLAAIVCEQAERDASYENILKSFTEIFKNKGSVY
ncbi:MAG: DUF87 domain-containing protein [Selenomonadaceae bacterium]|nr:DUF87 domain-containing protein [Selenomonadaceae bacterium]